jgi:hypothetical protein
MPQRVGVVSNQQLLCFLILIGCRPVLNGARVPPSELNKLRETHKFRGPCCLCASQSEQEDTYTETAMFLMTKGVFIGQYVATCAQSRCKYFCKLSSLLSISLPINSAIQASSKDSTHAVDSPLGPLLCAVRFY